jgi:hypothetical protein
MNLKKNESNRNHTSKFLVSTSCLPLFLFLSLFVFSFSLFSFFSLPFFSPSTEIFIPKMKTIRLVDDLVACLTVNLGTDDEIITYLKPFKLYICSGANIEHSSYWKQGNRSSKPTPTVRSRLEFSETSTKPRVTMSTRQQE